LEHIESGRATGIAIDLAAILATVRVARQTQGDQPRDPGGERVADGAGCGRGRPAP
jgi:hypothetical protein